MYEIQKDIPAPDRSDRGSRQYPWAQMVKGDSFFVPVSDFGEIQRTRNAVYSAASRAFGKGNCTIETRTEGDTLGVRVWRTG